MKHSCHPSSETASLTGPLVRELAEIPGLAVHRLNSGVAVTASGHRIKLCREGTPAILVHHGTVITYIETKAPGEELSAAQVAEQRRLRAAGAWVVTVEDYADGMRAARCGHTQWCRVTGERRCHCDQCGAWTL